MKHKLMPSVILAAMNGSLLLPNKLCHVFQKLPQKRLKTVQSYSKLEIVSQKVEQTMTKLVLLAEFLLDQPPTLLLDNVAVEEK